MNVFLSRNLGESIKSYSKVTDIGIYINIDCQKNVSLRNRQKRPGKYEDLCHAVHRLNTKPIAIL